MRAYEVTFADGSQLSVKVGNIRAESANDAMLEARKITSERGFNVDSFIAGTGIDWAHCDWREEA